MFHQHVVFQDAYLGDDTRVVVALAFPHHHGAVDRFPARQEFGFGEDVPFFAGFFSHFHAAAALGFQPGGAFEREGFGDEIILVFVIVGDVFVVDDAREQVVGFIAAAPTGAAFAAAAFRPVIIVFVVVEWVGVVGWGWGRRYGGCGE